MVDAKGHYKWVIANVKSFSGKFWLFYAFDYYNDNGNDDDDDDDDGDDDDDDDDDDDIYWHN